MSAEAMLRGNKKTHAANVRTAEPHASRKRQEKTYKKQRKTTLNNKFVI